jgi:hypothetical protein
LRTEDLRRQEAQQHSLRHGCGGAMMTRHYTDTLHALLNARIADILMEEQKQKILFTWVLQEDHGILCSLLRSFFTDMSFSSFLQQSETDTSIFFKHVISKQHVVAVRSFHNNARIWPQSHIHITQNYRVTPSHQGKTVIKTVGFLRTSSSVNHVCGLRASFEKVLTGRTDMVD